MSPSISRLLLILWLGVGCLEGDPLGDAPVGSGRGSASAGGDETGIQVGMTAEHNAVRGALGVGPPLGELTWSEDLAAYAQQWSENLAGRCGVIEHRAQALYGENIALRGSSRLVEAFTPDEVVAGWAAEEACWEFGTIQGSERCDAQCTAALNSNGCGHYTQVVWRNTQLLGCAYSTCQDARFTYEIWVCNYDPPGNFVGQAPY